MKIVKLPNGKTLPFDDDTDDETLDRTIKAYLGVKDAPEPEEILLAEMASQIVNLQSQMVGMQDQMLAMQARLIEQVGVFQDAIQEVSTASKMAADAMDGVKKAILAPKVASRDSNGVLVGISSVVKQDKGA